MVIELEREEKALAKRMRLSLKNFMGRHSVVRMPETWRCTEKTLRSGLSQVRSPEPHELIATVMQVAGGPARMTGAPMFGGWLCCPERPLPDGLVADAELYCGQCPTPHPYFGPWDGPIWPMALAYRRLKTRSFIGEAWTIDEGQGTERWALILDGTLGKFTWGMVPYGGIFEG